MEASIQRSRNPFHFLTNIRAQEETGFIGDEVSDETQATLTGPEKPKNPNGNWVKRHRGISGFFAGSVIVGALFATYDVVEHNNTIRDTKATVSARLDDQHILHGEVGVDYPYWEAHVQSVTVPLIRDGEDPCTLPVYYGQDGFTLTKYSGINGMYLGKDTEPATADGANAMLNNCPPK